MFWDAVIDGLKVLMYWETYVAALEYLVIFWVPIFILGMVAQREGRMAFGVGCFSMLLMPLVQVVAQVVFVLTLFPIIFGIAADAAWTFPFFLLMQEPIGFSKLIGFIAVAAIILAFIPLLGQLPSFHTLCLGGLALAFAVVLLQSSFPELAARDVRLWPGFWFMIGLLVVGGIVSWGAMLASAFVATALFSRLGEDLAGVVAMPIAALFGFVPVFMYGAWLGAQMRPA